MAPISISSPQQNNQIQVSNRDEEPVNNEPSLSGKLVVGLIIPPPDIRSLKLTN